MFESVTTFGDEDLELETSFSPVFSSTQETNRSKRPNENTGESSVKKVKLDFNHVTLPFVKDKSSGDSGYNSSPLPSKVVKRMFPGPAGLLNTHVHHTSKLDDHNRPSPVDVDDFLLCSQQTVSTFTEGPFSMMRDDFHTVEREQLYEKYNISWIKKNYSHKKILNNYKVPFLAAVIQNVDTLHGKIPYVHMTLKDTTGTIDATILYSCYKENSKYLKSESVIVLKQFSVLTTDEGHCITITSNNLLTIYYVEDPDVQNQKNEDINKTSYVKKIVLQSFRADDIRKEIEHQNHCDVLKSSSSSSKLNTSNICRNSFIPMDIVKPHKVIGFNPKPDNSVSQIFGLPTIRSMSVNNCKSCSSNSSNTVQYTNTEAVNEVKKKFNFKNETNIEKHSISANKNDESDVWKTMLEDVDPDSLFGDF